MSLTSYFKNKSRVNLIILVIVISFLLASYILVFHFLESKFILGLVNLIVLVLTILLIQKKNKEVTTSVEKNISFWKEKALHLNKINEAYSRFVPNEFLKLLEKESMLDVKLGDHIQKEMTILFSDIRQFTEMSEKMTPQENFNFLNSYLEVIGPIIRKHNGFIDKYIGDAIMALFAGEPDDALLAAIEMQEELRIFNFERASRGLEPVKVGIGIHTGNLILGTIGEKERMEGTVIADAVNLASRIESLTKEYYTSILVSEFSVRKMKNPKQFLLREIDYVVVKGKSNVITVLEC